MAFMVFTTYINCELTIITLPFGYQMETEIKSITQNIIFCCAH